MGNVSKNQDLPYLKPPKNRDNRRLHMARWYLEGKRIQARIVSLIEHEKTIPPDVAKLAQAWSTVEQTLRDLRMQPKPASAHVPIPAALTRLLGAQAKWTYPNGSVPAQLAMMPNSPVEMPEIVEAPSRPYPEPQTIEQQQITLPEPVNQQPPIG